MNISKMVVERERSSRKVVAAARTHGPLVREGVASFIGEEHADAAEKLMLASADKLKASTKSMVAADEAHIAELDDDAGCLRLRVERHHA